MTSSKTTTAIDDHAERGQQQTRLDELGDRVEAVGGGDCRAAPVAVAQRGFDLVVPQVVHLSSG